MINKFWKMMDRFFLLMIEETRENEMQQDENLPTSLQQNKER